MSKRFIATRILCVAVSFFGVIIQPSLSASSQVQQVGDDPPMWPVITAENAPYLAPLGIFGHGKNTEALWAWDGHTIVVGGTRGVWLYDARTPDAPPRRLDEPDVPVRDMALSHDGKLLAVSAGRDDSGFGTGGSIRIWDLATAKLQDVIPFSTPTIYFNVDDTQIIGQDNYFRDGGYVDVWSAKDGHSLANVSATDFYADNGLPDLKINLVHFGIQLQTMAMVNNPAMITAWATLQNAVAPQWANPTTQKLIDIPINHWLAFRPDTGLLALNWPGHWLLLFDLKRLAFVDAIDTFIPPAPDLTLSPDGKMRAVVEKGVVKVRDAKTNVVKAVLSGQAVNDWAFSYDDRTLALVTGEREVNVYDIATKHLKFSLVGHSAPVLHAAFSPNGNLIATTSKDRTVRLWDAATGKFRHVFYPGDVGMALAFSPDSRFLAVAGSNQTAYVWDVASHQLRGYLTELNFTASGLVFHPSGLISLYPNSGRNLIQWDWQHAVINRPKLTGIYEVFAVSSDGQSLLGASPVPYYDLPSITLYDIRSDYLAEFETVALPYHTGFSYNPGGKLMVDFINIPGNDGLSGLGYINVSDLYDSRLIQHIPNLDGWQWFYKVGFSAGGRLIAAINDEGALVVWRVAFPEWMQF